MQDKKYTLEFYSTNLEEVEKVVVVNVLRACEGNKSKVAYALGLDRRTLYRKLERWMRAANVQTLEQLEKTCAGKLVEPKKAPPMDEHGRFILPDHGESLELNNAGARTGRFSAKGPVPSNPPQSASTEGPYLLEHAETPQQGHW